MNGLAQITQEAINWSNDGRVRQRLYATWGLKWYKGHGIKKIIHITDHLHSSLLWRHNGRESVSNHQPHDCLFNPLIRRRSKKTSKLRVTGLCAGNSPGSHKWPVTWKVFPFDDVIMRLVLLSQEGKELILFGDVVVLLIKTGFSGRYPGDGINWLREQPYDTLITVPLLAHFEQNSINNFHLY